MTFLSFGGSILENVCDVYALAVHPPRKLGGNLGGGGGEQKTEWINKRKISWNKEYKHLTEQIEKHREIMR
jgi:hypothetical protein